MTEPTREPTFSDNFFEYTEMSRYKDVKIILVDEPMRPEYRLHKVILAANSSFFRKLFYHEPKEVYEIGAVTKKGFEAVLKLMYGKTLTLYTYSYDMSDIIIIQETSLYLGCRLIGSCVSVGVRVTLTYIGINSS